VKFLGIQKFYHRNVLSDDKFSIVRPGDTITFMVDIARTYNVSTGGIYEVNAHGIIPLAANGSTQLSGYVEYCSNNLRVNIPANNLTANEDGFTVDATSRTRIDPDSCDVATNHQFALQHATLCVYGASRGKGGALSGSPQTSVNMLHSTMRFSSNTALVSLNTSAQLTSTSGRWSQIALTQFGANVKTPRTMVL
jgi:Deuterolysin metalloprotease (M35) family